MSVDTHVRGRNLAAYHRVPVGPGAEVLLARPLLAVADRVRIARGGVLGRRLTVEVARTGEVDDCPV